MDKNSVYSQCFFNASCYSLESELTVVLYLLTGCYLVADKGLAMIELSRETIILNKTSDNDQDFLISCKLNNTLWKDSFSLVSMSLGLNGLNGPQELASFDHNGQMTVQETNLSHRAGFENYFKPKIPKLSRLFMAMKGVSKK